MPTPDTDFVDLFYNETLYVKCWTLSYVKTHLILDKPACYTQFSTLQIDMSCFAYFLNGIRPSKEDEPRVEDNFGFIHPWQTDHETKRVYLFGKPRPEREGSFFALVAVFPWLLWVFIALAVTAFAGATVALVHIYRWGQGFGTCLSRTSLLK